MFPKPASYRFDTLVRTATITLDYNRLQRKGLQYAFLNFKAVVP